MSNQAGRGRAWLVYLGVFAGGVVVGMLLLAAIDRGGDGDRRAFNVAPFAPALVLGTVEATPVCPTPLPAVAALLPTSQPATTPGAAQPTLASTFPTLPSPSPSATTPSPSATPSAAQPTLASTFPTLPSPSPSATTSSPSTTPSPSPTPSATSEAQALAQAMAARINEERGRSAPVTPAWQSGQPPAQPKPLRVDERLKRVADAHARDMAERGYLSHVNPEGQTPEGRVRAAGVSALWVGENIYQGYGEGTVEQAMSMFMTDPPHRDAILDPRFTRLGVGVYVGADRKVYFVQLFAQSPED